MFNRRKQKLIMLQNVTATSKTSLKLQCLTLAKGNVKEAGELYDFLAADITLPDFDPVKPTFLESTKQTADGILAWIEEHKETLADGYDFIRALAAKRAPKEPLPNIN